MASTIPVRITGLVLRTDRREIVRKSDGQRFVFLSANVLVGGAGTTEVTFREDEQRHMPTKGEVIDYLCNASSYQGDPQFAYLDVFEDEFAPAAKAS